MGIIHHMFRGFLWMVLVLVPENEIEVFYVNMVNDDAKRLFVRLFGVSLESIGKKREIELVFVHILNQIRPHVVQFYQFKMDSAIQDLTDVHLGTQGANTRQVTAIQVFDNDFIQNDTKIRCNQQTTHLDVATSFFRKVSAGITGSKLLKHRVLNSNKETSYDAQQHHNHNQNAMDNLFFNNFDPPN